MKNAPRYLTLRYGALNAYVWEGLFPQEYRNKIIGRVKDPVEKKAVFIKMKAFAEEASLLVFIFVTRRIFNEGSTAAKSAVDVFKELDVREFYLGNTKFSGRNENVVMGDTLAEALMAGLDKKTKSLILESNYVSEIVDIYKKIRSNIYD